MTLRPRAPPPWVHAHEGAVPNCAYWQRLSRDPEEGCRHPQRDGRHNTELQREGQVKHRDDRPRRAPTSLRGLGTKTPARAQRPWLDRNAAPTGWPPRPQELFNQVFCEQIALVVPRRESSSTCPLKERKQPWRAPPVAQLRAGDLDSVSPVVVDVFDVFDVSAAFHWDIPSLRILALFPLPSRRHTEEGVIS